MLRFLSKFRLATRVYGAFVLMGAFAVLLCFLGAKAVETVQREYTKANGVIDSARQMTVLETDFYALNQALFYFEADRSESEKKKVENALRRFEDRASEIEQALSALDNGEKTKTVLTDVAKHYRTGTDALFALFAKSAEAAGKVAKYADRSSEKLAALSEEVSLPSASFALNNLREQLDDVLTSVDAMGKTDIRKQLTVDLAELKKAAASAKQAEMINTKQLSVVTAALKALDEEINRKLKLDDSLRDKIAKLAAESGKNVEKLNAVLDELGTLSSDFVAKAETDKIMLQKLFVVCAAAGGVLAVLLSFLALYGIRGSLSRLVECATEIARGNRSVLIHFTERGDEVGALARALSALSAHLKDLPVLSDTALLGRPDTYGAPVSYVPLGAPNATSGASKDESEVAYFGQGVGVNAESQLCRMLELLQQLGAAAADMSQDSKSRFAQCQERLAAMTEALGFVHRNLEDTAARFDWAGFENIKNDMKALFDFLQAFSVIVETMRSSADSAAQSADYSMKTVNQATAFVSDLFEWAKSTLDLTAQIRNNATETKILALNASIEAAKAGEKAKSFGAAALDIRVQTQKTEDAIVRLSEQLKTVQQGACNFAEVMKRITSELDVAVHSAAGAVTTAENEKNQIDRAIRTLQNAGTETEKLQNAMRDLAPVLNELPAHLGDAEALIPFLERDLSGIAKKFEDFVAILPTYEEEEDPS